jgi:4-amino-4-deoxy-L-arabinose transferase-like glycosyltransferase
LGLLSRQAYSISTSLVLIPIVLSAYTHLWNPAGFPNLFYDEGVYMRRAMHVMEGLGPQEAYYYDHPFFGQIFLAALLTVVGYPQSLNPSADLHSIELLYLVPRALMGILAIIDTFLIYKISERLYNRNVALFGSTLFAVMPATWFTRMMLLDSLLLPLLLSSILLTLYTTRRSTKNKTNNVLILLSGVFLGLAIFTKIPAFTMIPLVGFLVYRNNKSLKSLGMWFIPVILIPLIWPAQSIAVGRFDSWTNDVLWQIDRDNAGLPWIIFLLGITDPILFVAGFAGLAHSFIKRDYAIILWILPFLAFLAAMGYANFFYWIPILPALCMGAAKLVFDIIDRIKESKQKLIRVILVSSITIFGLTSTSMLIITNVTSAQLESAAYVSNYLAKSTNHPTVVSNPVYSWIFKYVFNKDNVLSDYRDMLYSSISDDERGILLIDDPRFKLDIGNEDSELLHALYRNTSTIAIFKGNVTNFDLGLYPYTSMVENYEGSEVGIRVSNSNS